MWRTFRDQLGWLLGSVAAITTTNELNTDRRSGRKATTVNKNLPISTERMEVAVDTMEEFYLEGTQSKPEKGIVLRAPACLKRKLFSSGSSSSDCSEGEEAQSKTSTVTKSPKADGLQLDPVRSDSCLTELSRDVELPDADVREQANAFDENDAAIKGLAETILSENDGDESDLPIRLSLRTPAKKNPKLKPKLQKRILPKRGQQQRRMEMTSSLKSLTSTRRRYMMQRAGGLVVSLQERKETPLQRLLQTIATKSIQEVDSEKKLGMCASVKLTKVDLTNTEKIKKFTAVLNRDKVADGGRHSGRKLSNNKHKPDVKSPVNNDEDSLSEFSSQESDKNEIKNSESDVENNKEDDDILLLPDTENQKESTITAAVMVRKGTQFSSQSSRYSKIIRKSKREYVPTERILQSYAYGAKARHKFLSRGTFTRLKSSTWLKTVCDSSRRWKLYHSKRACIRKNRKSRV